MPGMRVVVLLAAVLVQGPVRADFVTAGDFTDLLFWAGSGTNQAAFVTFFDDPVYGDGDAPAAVAWGYRWDGQKTQADMLFALAGSITVNGSAPSPPVPQPGSDPRLAIDVDYFTSGTLSGYLLNAIRYDQVGLPAPWSPSVRVMDASGPAPESGYLYIAPYRSGPGSGGAWPAGGVLDLIPDTGIFDTPLEDDAWYGFVETVYAYTLVGDQIEWLGFPGQYTFAQPVAAIPEPSAVTLLAWGGVCAAGIAARRRRSRLPTARHATSSGPRHP